MSHAGLMCPNDSPSQRIILCVLLESALWVGRGQEQSAETYASRLPRHELNAI
jgi:hypothetical protein